MRLRQFLSILFVTIPLWMLAQTYGSLTMENGLMDNTVTAFCQDDHGMMFLGNYRGVDRFDGSHVVNIPFEPNNDEESNCITAIVEEDKEHLLVGNADGLWRLDKRRLTLTRIFQKTIDCGVTALQVKRTKGRKGSKIIISTQLRLRNGQRHRQQFIRRLLAEDLQSTLLNASQTKRYSKRMGTTEKSRLLLQIFNQRQPMGELQILRSRL